MSQNLLSAAVMIGALRVNGARVGYCDTGPHGFLVLYLFCGTTGAICRSFCINCSSMTQFKECTNFIDLFKFSLKSD